MSALRPLALCFALFTLCCSGARSGSAVTAQQADQPAPDRTPPERTPPPSEAAPARNSPAAVSNTRWARRVVEIGDIQPSMRLQISPRIREIVAKQSSPMLGVPESQVQRALKIEENGHEIALTLDLSDVNGAAPAAREFLDRVVHDLHASIVADRDGEAKQIVEQSRQDQAKLKAELEDLQQNLRKLKSELRAKTGRVDTNPEALREALRRLDEQRTELEFEEAAKQARRDALTKALADATARVEQRVKQDEVVAELQKVVDARQMRVDSIRKMMQAGQASASEVGEAEAQLAEARAQLLERRQQAAEQAGGDLVSQWNRELLTLGVDEQELANRLSKVSEALGKLASVVDSLDELQQMQESLEHAREGMRDSEAQIRSEQARAEEIRRLELMVTRESKDATTKPSEDE